MKQTIKVLSFILVTGMAILSCSKNGSDEDNPTNGSKGKIKLNTIVYTTSDGTTVSLNLGFFDAQECFGANIVSNYYSADGVGTITFDGDVTMIGYRVFEKSTLTSITIPDGVTSIEYYAFSNCSSLTSITIPDGVKNIGSGAFSGCSGLTSIIIPDGVTTIASSAFSGCSGLTSITIPDGVTSIEDYAFNNCYSLTSITIPDGVTTIASSAFSNCSSLTSIIIPDGVKNIESGAFSGCSGLTSITIPDGVTSIGYYAFSDCYSLTSITIPDGVTSIGYYAFSNCSSLTSFTVPNGVTFNDETSYIGDGVLSGCSNLEWIKLSSNFCGSDYWLDMLFSMLNFRTEEEMFTFFSRITIYVPYPYLESILGRLSELSDDMYNVTIEGY